MSLISSLLRIPISLPVQTVQAIKRTLYSLGILKAKKLDAYVVSVGNMSFGGTGKTPITIDVAKDLARDSELKVAVLTRGYKSSKSIQEQYPLVIDSENLANYSAEDLGDEAYMMAESFANDELDIKVIVDPNRYRAGSFATENLGIDLFILDDGFQHLRLHRDLEIIVKNLEEKGFMREFSCYQSAADYLLYTNKIIGKSSQQLEELLQSDTEACINYKLEPAAEIDSSKGILAFSALADNESFFSALNDCLSVELSRSDGLDSSPSGTKKQSIRTISFPDHHQFDINEVKSLISTGMNLLCTRKDYVKIPLQYRDKFIPVNLSLDWNPVGVQEEIKGRIVNGTKDRTTAMATKHS